jgi:spore maturation protein CgeB
MIKLGIPDAILRSLPGISKARTWKSMPALPMIPELREVLHPPVFGLKMFETLARSKVTFNKHIDASPFSASNMRMFEATGSGTCLMTDAKRNIRELFEPDYEVVTYETTGECIEKVRWLLDHPAEQKAIAQKGQERCLKEHTFTQRAPTLDRLIRKNL